MSDYHVLGIEDAMAGEVRGTLRSPEYGHPVVREVARGTGPCRACLEPFRVGTDERLLFTYRPRGGSDTLTAPGPVFIHAEECRQYRGTTYPAALHEIPVLLEAWAAGHTLASARRAAGTDVDAAIVELLSDPAVEYVHVRHAEAGCHVVRVGRGPLPAEL